MNGYMYAIKLYAHKLIQGIDIHIEVNIKYWMFSYTEIGIEFTCVGQWLYIYLSTNQNIDVYQSSG